ncbi:MAG: SDR family oxidoreductase [Nitrospinota bacterium]
MSERKTALVVGATGVIGGSLIKHLEGLEDWDTVGVCRRPPGHGGRTQYISIDLSEPVSGEEHLAAMSGVTHIFYAGYTDRPTFAEQTAPNTALFVNAVEAFEPRARNLAHICLVQGSKYYGRHLGPFRTPAKEDDARHMPPNFYFDQQDFLAARQQGKRWTWSCARPQTVAGAALGGPLNMISVIAVFAAISKELGLPLRFPGNSKCYGAIFQVTDADLLAKALVWMATEPRCAGQAFNIANGDVFRWENTWPKIAAYFGMQAGPVHTISLAEMMADKDALWLAMVEKYGLRPGGLEEIVNWRFGDYLFSNEWDVMMDTIKCREHGFTEFIDTEKMFLAHFEALRRDGVIP